MSTLKCKRQLPRFAAAGGGLRAGRPRGHRPDDRSRSATTATASPSISRTSGRRPRRFSEVDRPVRQFGACSRSSTATCSRATSCGTRFRSREGKIYAWDAILHLCEASALLRRHGQDAEAGGRYRQCASTAPFSGTRVTTDHISPAGNISKTSPAAKYLTRLGVQAKDFNSYGARRGNHEVMMRGTFANIRLRNLLLPGTEGGVTLHIPSGEQMSHLRCRDAIQGGRLVRWSSWRARSTAPAHRATGRRKARCCSGCER